MLSGLAPLTAANAATLFSENFDGVTTPALPGGWTNTNAAGANPWVTSAGTGVGGTQSAFVREPSSVSDSRLTSPVISMAGASNGILTFQQRFDLEERTTNPVGAFDAAVLEASLNGGAFQDILGLGATFVAGEYAHEVRSGTNPLGVGRRVWSGNSGGYITTTVDLPASFDNQSVQFRWRAATDASVAGAGWNIDSIVLTADTGPTPAPVPATLMLLGLGALGLGARRRRA